MLRDHAPSCSACTVVSSTTAASRADNPPAGSSVDSNASADKRNHTLCADRFEAAAGWQSFWTVVHAEGVAWDGLFIPCGPLREVLQNFPEHLRFTNRSPPA